MAKTKRKPRVKQPYLAEDMAPDAVPAIDEAAESYVEARDARMENLKLETKRQDALLELIPDVEYVPFGVAAPGLEKFPKILCEWLT